MKGAIHATLKGYNVAVLKDAVVGSSSPENWKTSGDHKNAPPLCRGCNKK